MPAIVPQATPPQGSAQPAPPADDFDHCLGDTFTLGKFEYRINSFERPTSIGNRFTREQAGSGSTFLLVRYTETNRGPETVTGTEGPMQLLDQQGRTFHPSSRAMTSLAMSGHGDLLLTELHPGVSRDGIVAFEVPADPPDMRFRVAVQERGVFGTGQKRVVLRTRQDERGWLIVESIVGNFAVAARDHDLAGTRALLASESAAMGDGEVTGMMDDFTAMVPLGHAIFDFESVAARVDGAWRLKARPLDARGRETGDRVTFVVVEEARRYRLRRVVLEPRRR